MQYSHIEDKKRLLIYKGSKQTEKQSKRGIEDMLNSTDELIHSHRPKQAIQQNPSTHRRIQTQQDDSL